MPNLIALGAGAGATALTLILGLAFWTPMDMAPSTGKSVVVQPVFVSATAAKPQASPASTAPSAAEAAAAPPAANAVADASAMAKLAASLQSNPAAGGPVSVVTRSVTIAGANPAANEAARRLCAQGLVAMAAGDIAGSRLYLERAAEAGDARALMVLGESYDPATLARMGALGIKGDSVKARDYYAKALAAGMGAARERMAALVSQ